MILSIYSYLLYLYAEVELRHLSTKTAIIMTISVAVIISTRAATNPPMSAAVAELVVPEEVSLLST